MSLTFALTTFTLCIVKRLPSLVVLVALTHACGDDGGGSTDTASSSPHESVDSSAPNSSPEQTSSPSLSDDPAPSPDPASDTDDVEPQPNESTASNDAGINPPLPTPTVDASMTGESPADASTPPPAAPDSATSMPPPDAASPETSPRDAAPAQCGAVGTWTLGDDNLFVVIDTSCAITNFCDIMNGIHTVGALTASELHLDSVGGSPLSFTYTLTEDTLTIIDGFGDVDLPLMRIPPAELPPACFDPS